MSKAPKGYRAVTPYLIFSNADSAMSFYKKALGAIEIFRLPMANGRIGHMEFQIDDSRLMGADEAPEWGARSVKSVGGTPVTLCMYTDDVEALAARFVEAGGKELRPLRDQFYGDRSGQFEDPEGYVWTLAQHIEDVSPEEMVRRMPKG